MSWRNRIVAGLVGGLLMSCAAARGHDLFDEIEDHGLIYKSKHQKSNVATPHTFHQAGHPHLVSAFAHPSYSEHYSGGYIGGGSPRGGRGPCPQEGTWGWDYTPFHPMTSRIFLNWSNGRRYQGGTNAYATDGPKPLEKFRESVHEHMGSE